MNNKATPTSSVIIIIIVLIVLVGGIISWEYLKIPAEKSETEKLGEEGKTTEWKNYKYNGKLESAWNEEYVYQYEIMYLSNWKIEHPNPYNLGQIEIIADTEMVTIQPGLWGSEQDSSEEALYFAYQIALFAQTANGFETYSEEDIVFKNYSGKKLVYSHPDYPGVFETFYLIQKDRITYILKLISSKRSEENNIFQQMFSSFKI